MPVYKLIYFNSKARAESIRLMFHLSGTEYEDFRIMHVDWPKYKLQMPYGQVPVLEVEGGSLTQVKAIARFVAKRTGFYGNNDIERAQIDEVMDMCEDWHRPINTYIGLTSQNEKETQMKLINTIATEICSNLVKRFAQRADSCHYFVGKRMTLADLYVFGDLEFVSIFVTDIFDNFPELKTFRDHIVQDAQVAEWLTKRPETQF